MFESYKKLNPVVLYCIPFAGGDSRSYRNLQKYLDHNILVKSPEPAGRNSRLDETPLTDIHQIANDFFQQLKKDIQTQNYALYGHSMGGLLVYLLTHLIIENNFSLPKHLLVSGSIAPSVPRPLPYKHLLSKEDFMKYIQDFGGLPDELLAYPEIFDFFEPILRADIQAVECYQYQAKALFNLPLTVLYGDQDKNAHQADVLPWQKETSQHVMMHSFQGGHFFINKHIAEIGKLFSKALNS
ncbi:MAG: alpha/beta fold hydrolase [Thiofilum sp.]|uniref:thioesterase II family protein n=1 Tax=Thiofilum sp. TaxID=2212733 RepID=UPI0025CB8D85|nr:alpha/beta fold hydrolase [Thiofilum sp.]MBK8452748.1 thioesterase [Thiofilum sp.]